MEEFFLGRRRATVALSAQSRVPELRYHPHPPTSTIQAGDAGEEQTLKEGSPFLLHPTNTGQHLCVAALQSPLGLKAEQMCNCSWAG